MKKILLLICLLSSTAFAQNVKFKVGLGYERRDNDTIIVSVPKLKEVEFDCNTPLGVSKDFKDSISTTEIVSNIFAFESKKTCLVSISYKLPDGPSIMLGQIRIPLQGNVNETVFHGTTSTLDQSDVYYTPTFWLAP